MYSSEYIKYRLYRKYQCFITVSYKIKLILLVINFIFSFALLKLWLCYANFLLVVNKDFF